MLVNRLFSGNIDRQPAWSDRSQANAKITGFSVTPVPRAAICVRRNRVGIADPTGRIGNRARGSAGGTTDLPLFTRSDLPACGEQPDKGAQASSEMEAGRTTDGSMSVR